MRFIRQIVLDIFYGEGYKEKLERGEEQRQLSKEFVREWLMANKFQGLEGQLMPEMPDAIVEQISARYIELHDIITGAPFVKTPFTENDIESAILEQL